MNKFLLIGPVLLLTGCTQWGKLTGTGSTPVAQASTPYVVGAGQSNMEFEHLSDTFPDSVNIAHNGTFISQWQKGTPLYNRMLEEVQAHPNSVVLFWQGEGEGMSQWYVPWAEGFTSMVRSLRVDAGREVVIVYVQIGQISNVIYPNTSYWQTIQQEQTTISLPNVFMISAKDMFPEGDAVHYSQVQYRIMQARMLEAIHRSGLVG